MFSVIQASSSAVPGVRPGDGYVNGVSRSLTTATTDLPSLPVSWGTRAGATRLPTRVFGTRSPYSVVGWISSMERSASWSDRRQLWSQPAPTCRLGVRRPRGCSAGLDRRATGGQRLHECRSGASRAGRTCGCGRGHFAYPVRKQGEPRGVGEFRHALAAPARAFGHDDLRFQMQFGLVRVFEDPLPVRAAVAAVEGWGRPYPRPGFRTHRHQSDRLPTSPLVPSPPVSVSTRIARSPASSANTAGGQPAAQAFRRDCPFSRKGRP